MCLLLLCTQDGWWRVWKRAPLFWVTRRRRKTVVAEGFFLGIIRFFSQSAGLEFAKGTWIHKTAAVSEGIIEAPTIWSIFTLACRYLTFGISFGGPARERCDFSNNNGWNYRGFYSTTDCQTPILVPRKMLISAAAWWGGGPGTWLNPSNLNTHGSLQMMDFCPIFTVLYSSGRREWEQTLQRPFNLDTFCNQTWLKSVSKDEYLVIMVEESHVDRDFRLCGRIAAFDQSASSNSPLWLQEEEASQRASCHGCSSASSL